MTEIAALNIKVETSQVKAASKDLEGLTKSGGQAETATDRLQGSMMALGGAAKALASSYVALKVAKYIKDSAMLAARYETLGVVMGVVGKNAGYTAGQMEDMAQGLQKTGISMNESRQTLTRMTQAQLDLTKSSQLARVAQDAAVIGNVNSSEAFQRIVYGIQSGQVEVLRTIGINVSFEKSYAKLAQELHKTVGSLTEQEKTQARMNAAMEAGKRIAGTYEGAMSTTGKQVNSLARYHEDLGVEIGKTFNPATNALVAAYTAAIKLASKEIKKFNAEQQKIGSAEREWERVVTSDPFATSAERQLQARAKAEKEARQSVLNSDKGRAEMLAAKRQDENAYQSTWGERTSRAPKERFTTLGAQTGVATANAALRNAIAEAGGDELNITLTRLAGERAAKIAQYQATMANPDILPGVAGAHTAQRAIEEKTYFEQVEQAKRDAAQKTGAFIGKLEAERAQKALDQKQAILDAENERKTEAIAVARTVGGLDIVDQQNQLKDLYEEAKNYTDDRVGLEMQLNRKLAVLESQRLKKTENPYDGMKAGLLDYTESVGTASSRMSDLMGKGFKGAEDALSQMVGKGKLDIASLFDLMRVEAARSMVVQPMLGGFASALKNTSWLSSFFPSADGNAFGPGGVYAFASGGIVSSPTAFRFGAGGANLGIMGEAGPEAIMPLKRGSDGKLGVAAGGGAGAAPNITFVMQNRTGQNVKLSTSKVSQGDDGTTVTLLLDLVQRNVGGLRTGLQAALGS